MSHQNDTDERPQEVEEAPEDPEASGDGTTLEFEDTVELETTKDQLWETISDPETLTQCVPGAESIERVSERKYTLEIERGISHLTISIEGEAEFVEMEPPDYIVTRGTAFDSKTGSDIHVVAAMELQEGEDGAVALAYRAEVDLSGGAGSLRPRLLRPLVNRDVSTYFENVRDVVEAGGDD